MAITRGIKQLLAEANARVESLAPDEAQGLLEHPDVQFIDLRDVRELEREGMLPGAFHAPRGMLEFWVDPDSPYYKPVFGSDKRFVLYCQSGWRSALAAATLLDMGMQRIAHVAGGFNAWRQIGGPVVPRPSRS